MKNLLKLVVLGATLCLASCAGEQTPIYLDDSKPIEARVEDALQRMTFDEKIAMIHAQSKFSSPGVPRLGIPEVWCSDGPHGVRHPKEENCTSFPNLCNVAATFDTDLVYEMGQALAKDCIEHDVDMLLGPGINIKRYANCGRNYSRGGINCETLIR